MTEPEIHARVLALEGGLAEINVRLGRLRTWLIVLTALQTVEFGALVAILLRL